MLLRAVIMSLRSTSAEAGDILIQRGAIASEMYLICQGEAEVLNPANRVTATLRTGDFFGEIGLLASVPRTSTVRAGTRCDLFILEQKDFFRIMRDHPHLAESMTGVARDRYELALSFGQLMGGQSPIPPA